MHADLTVNVADIFAAIVADIKAAYPQFVNVEFFPDEPEANTRMPVPACLLDVSEMSVEPEEDPGTGQTATQFSFSAFIVISGLQDGNTKLMIRLLAASLVSWLRMRHWTDPSNPGAYLQSDPAMPVGAYRDDFNPALDRYEVWRVDWEQVFYLGENNFNETLLPSHVWLGLAPDIGAAHKADYVELTGDGQ